jgi:hypothetical protein
VTLEERVLQLEAQVKALLPGGVKPSEAAADVPEPAVVPEPTTEAVPPAAVDAPAETPAPGTA